MITEAINRANNQASGSLTRATVGAKQPRLIRSFRPHLRTSGVLMPGATEKPVEIEPRAKRRVLDAAGNEGPVTPASEMAVEFARRCSLSLMTLASCICASFSTPSASQANDSLGCAIPVT